MKRSALVMCVLLSSCMPESTFTLGAGSRPPKWCSGSSSVTMSYYIGPSGSYATFECSSVRSKITGRARDLKPLTLANPPAGSSPGYPSYEVITVDGVTDIVEHRAMEPFFFMTDNPAVWKELGVPANNALQPTDSPRFARLAAAERGR